MSLQDSLRTLRERYRIRAYEVDPNGKVTIQSICNYLQETAGNHAHRLGVAVDDLLKENLTWVLSRLHVSMDKYPFWRQELSIETWPSRVDTIYAIRDFRLYDAGGKEIGRATSSWMLIDFVKRKPVLLPDTIKSFHLGAPPRAIEDPFDALPEPDTEQYLSHFNVRVSDLDMNHHVNNVNYIEWGLESIPAEIHKQHRLSDIEITFKAESNYGDRVRSVSEQKSDGEVLLFYHRLSRERDQKQLARMRSRWVREEVK